jgi:hypothetical protein
MRNIGRTKVMLIAGALLGVGIMAAPAQAAPTYPMIFLTINAPLPSTSAPTFTIDAQFPLGWDCTSTGLGLGLTWNAVTGVATVRCAPPAPANMALTNTCGWNVVKVMSTGVSGRLYGESFCDSRAGASASIAAPTPLTANAAYDNNAFTVGTCRATASPDALVRPWVVRCSINH